MASHNHVLVLDGDKVHALDIVRSLGRAGVRVSVAASRADAIAFHSRFARATDVYPNPAADRDAFIQWLEDRLRREPCDLVIPVTDLTGVPISLNIGRLRKLTALATESHEKLQLVCDKSRTLDIARAVDVPVPATVLVTHERELEFQAARLVCPLVCKPLASSVWSASGYVSCEVFYALDEDELRREVRKRLAACPVLLQEYRPGVGVGIELLAKNGEILQAFQHRRLHELPLTGGGSTYRISEPVDPILRGHAERLIAAIGWTGVAMVEFKVNPATRDAVLMEINGRFWGSLALSSRAGMRFAVDLYEMLALGARPAPREYRSGVRCRKLRDDIEWFKAQTQLSAHDSKVEAGLVQKRSAGQLLGDAGRMVSPREYFDVQVLWDPVPGVRDLRQIAREHVAIVRRRAGAAVRRVRSRWYARRNLARLVEAAREARTVLFVCYGNIMRSPFAGSYLRLRVAGSHRAIQAVSAGVYERSGRPADPRMVTASRHWNVDLTSHQSRIVTADLVARADLVLVMDRANLGAMRRLYPEAAAKTFLLGTLDADGTTEVEIPDPFDDGYDATETVCRRIAAAVDRLVETRVSVGGAVQPCKSRRSS